MLRERLNKDLLIFDGGFGSQLQELGMKAGEIPEGRGGDRHGEKAGGFAGFDGPGDEPPGGLRLLRPGKGRQSRGNQLDRRGRGLLCRAFGQRENQVPGGAGILCGAAGIGLRLHPGHPFRRGRRPGPERENRLRLSETEQAGGFDGPGNDCRRGSGLL